ncbi:hypothetical protein FGSG_10278 [Fusarium graminearum PH-1]|uniref:hypothetical protein n=1 Tax=Gibberella zeae (strain ATCC MYA-4620 / CBS 123657 / FGSC 9075 / NRRL 31084 / PH-1) TaxID=229533 RepID=UPI00021F12A3|nr:hypothetical protein FGSG_10278 [Fusarium graminearum PH-1]ESU16971.1 hypothetical protein FGSG_10278 [Fusarium graminearum PH-1]|eukprot:XP_011319233.1 hypothetical protein FGSG_10278 [Fusarium graminearum PH-1]
MASPKPNDTEMAIWFHTLKLGGGVYLCIFSFRIWKSIIFTSFAATCCGTDNALSVDGCLQQKRDYAQPPEAPMPFALLTARCLREETSLNLPHAVSFLPLLCVRGSQLCNRIAAHGRRRAAPFNIDRSRPALCCLEREQRTPALPVRCATDVHTSQSCPAFAFIFRIKPKVIDNAQGDEADLSSTTWSPHLHQSSAEDLRGTPAFVAADLRCTLGLIRSIAFLVVLANRGNFIGHEKNAITQGRAQDLAVYKSFAQRGVNKRFKSCKKCETHDHTTGDCTADGINMSDKSVTTTPLANALSTISYALHVDERSITILTAPHPPVASGAARASAPRASALSTISYVLHGDERATLLQLHHTRKGPVVHKTRDVWTHTIPMSSINLDHCRLLSDLADLDLRLASHSNLLKELLGVGNAMSGLATEVVRDEMNANVAGAHQLGKSFPLRLGILGADGAVPVPNIMRPYPLAGELRSTENSFNPGQKETEVDNLTVELRRSSFGTSLPKKKVTGKARGARLSPAKRASDQDVRSLGSSQHNHTSISFVISPLFLLSSCTQKLNSGDLIPNSEGAYSLINQYFQESVWP